MAPGVDPAAVDRLQRELTAIVGRARVGVRVPLAPLTTFRVGGPADLLVEARSGGEIVELLVVARRCGVPVTMLGGGSNVLVADAGVRGLVIRTRAGAIDEVGPGIVRADAGVTINGLVRWTIGRALAGLEAWAGTPGTVGGGIYGNAHWSGRLLSEVVESVRLCDRAGVTSDVAVDEMGFGYDCSRLQTSGEILLSAVFRCEPGDPDELRAIARASLAFRKRTQPLHAPSAGCVFQNPSPGERMPPGVPRSAGALIDAAGLKGRARGAARISPLHANFFVNEGVASAADVRALIEEAREAVASRFGILLRDEIVYLGDFGEGTEASA